MTEMMSITGDRMKEIWNGFVNMNRTLELRNYEVLALIDILKNILADDVDLDNATIIKHGAEA